RCVFFFQAEDGIRDFHVTGVQTCALPISLPSPRWTRAVPSPLTETRSALPSRVRSREETIRVLFFHPLEIRLGSARADMPPVGKIGRASCRERVEDAEVAGAGRRTGMRTR